MIRIISIFLLTFVLFSCENSTKSTTEGPSTVRYTGDAANQEMIQILNFLNDAASSSRLKVALDQMAMSRTSNKELKDFSIRLAKEHSKLNNELMTLINNFNIEVDQQMSNSDQEVVENLQNIKDTNFDSKYIDLMAQALEDNINKYEANMVIIEQPDFNRWVLASIRKFKSQLAEAEEISKEL